MNDRLDCDVQDAEALAEIRMTTDLMIAATESSHRLSQAQIDDVLGLDNPDSVGQRTAPGDLHEATRHRTQPPLPGPAFTAPPKAS